MINLIPFYSRSKFEELMSDTDSIVKAYRLRITWRPLF